MGGKRWTESEVAYLVEHYPHRSSVDIAAELDRQVNSVYQQAYELGLRKTHEYRVKASERLNCPQGKRHQFQPGLVPWNKGKSHKAGGRSAETRFKPGNKPQTWQPIGHERLHDGYLQRKMTDTGESRRDYVPVHRLVWEEHNGPIPDGFIVIFKDNDKTNIVIDNLEVIDRQELMQRNSVHRYPPEMVAAIQQVNGLRRRIKHIEKKRGKAA